MPHGREVRTDVDRKLWSTPVPERAQLVADLAKQLFGRKRTEVSLRVDDRHLQLTVSVKNGARGKMARLNHDLFLKLAVEALDVDVLGTYQKHGTAYLKLSGTPARAENARRASTLRKYKRNALAVASYVLAFWSALEVYDACREVRIVWNEEGSDLRAIWLLAMWIGLAFGWCAYHYIVRHTVLGPMVRFVDQQFGHF